MEPGRSLITIHYVFIIVVYGAAYYVLTVSVKLLSWYGSKLIAPFLPFIPLLRCTPCIPILLPGIVAIHFLRRS